MKSATENIARDRVAPSPTPTPSQCVRSLADELARILTGCGFDARVWRGQRVYLGGYGRDITAFFEPRTLCPEHPADGVRLDVRSSWQAARYNGLRCKGVKHAILKDLWRACLLSAPPPDRWQDVPLTEAPLVRPVIRPFETQNSESAQHQKTRSADDHNDDRVVSG
jgi:hypothetical protein